MTPMPTHSPHQGMPPLGQDGPPVSFFEFWPMWAFYPPIFAYALWLMVRYRGIALPTIANPSFPGGGLFGESKAEILALACQSIPEWVAPFVAVERPEFGGDVGALERLTSDTLGKLQAAGLALPLVAKPDLGCRGAGVKVVRNPQALKEYFAAFPAGAKVVLQKLIDYEGEAGIFYCRRPDEAKGRIISITLKYFPHVIGDGVRTLRQLIMEDPRSGRLPHLYLHRHTSRLDTVPAQGEAIRLAFAGSHSRGAIFRDGTELVTPEMEARFDELSKRIPEFYFGRYDIRFADFKEVQAGRNFTILEVNGAGAESTHVWDRKFGLFRAWGDLMAQYRLLFQIGRANRDRGYKPLSLRQFLEWRRREMELTPLYPATD